jgi:polyisoprenoid-binding protein YceI
MRFLFTFIATCCLSVSAHASAEKYEFDKSHTRILFFVNHLGFSDTVGEFTAYDGTFSLDLEKPETSTLDVTLKPAGIRTPSEALDKHLQNADFFNVEKFPDIRFVSKSVKKTGDNTGEVTGDLTMLGVTKPVVMKVKLNKADYHPKTQDYIAGFTGETTLKRSEFGMNFGIPMVGDEVRMVVHTELVNLDRKKTDAIKH